jgi:hypothetical protein
VGKWQREAFSRQFNSLGRKVGFQCGEVFEDGQSGCFNPSVMNENFYENSY